MHDNGSTTTTSDALSMEDQGFDSSAASPLAPIVEGQALAQLPPPVIPEDERPTPTFKPRARMPLYLRLILIYVGYFVASFLFLMKATEDGLADHSFLFFATAIVFTAVNGMIAIFDLRLFGEQNRPHQWPLCLAFVMAFFTLVLALFMPPSLTETTVQTSEWFGYPLAETFATPMTYLQDIYPLILIFFCTFCFLRLRPIRLRALLVFLTFAIAILVTILTQPFQLTSLFGLMGFTLAFYFHLSPLRGLPEMKGILQRLTPLHETHPKLTEDALRVSLRLCDGTPLQQKHLHKFVKQSDPQQLTTALIQLGIITTFASRERQIIQLDPTVRYLTKHSFRHHALSFIALILLAMAWAILPYDFIPDAIPYYGCLDDMLVAFITLRALSRNPS